MCYKLLLSGTSLAFPHLIFINLELFLQKPAKKNRQQCVEIVSVCWEIRLTNLDCWFVICFRRTSHSFRSSFNPHNPPTATPLPGHLPPLQATANCFMCQDLCLLSCSELFVSVSAALNMFSACHAHSHSSYCFPKGWIGE